MKNCIQWAGVIGQKLKSLDAKVDNLRWSSRNPNSGRKAPVAPNWPLVSMHGHRCTHKDTHINSK